MTIEVAFFLPDESDAIRIHETYREDGEPDSPLRPFTELSEIEKCAVIKNHSKKFQVASVNRVKVGWVSFSEKSGGAEINVGFGLFKEYRGRAMGQIMLGHAVKIAGIQYPKGELIARTRVENTAAVKTLGRAGFTQEGFEEFPPIAKWPNPIVYSRHRFKR